MQTGSMDLVSRFKKPESKLCQNSTCSFEERIIYHTLAFTLPSKFFMNSVGVFCFQTPATTCTCRCCSFLFFLSPSTDQVEIQIHNFSVCLAPNPNKWELKQAYVNALHHRSPLLFLVLLFMLFKSGCELKNLRTTG